MPPPISEDVIFRKLVSLINSFPQETPSTLTRVLKAFEELECKSVPYRDFGFPSAQAMLESRPDLFHLSLVQGLLVIRTRDLPEASKVKDLVQSQQIDKNKLKQNKGILSKISKTAIPGMPTQHREFMILEGSTPVLPNLVKENIHGICYTLPESFDFPHLQRVYKERFGLSLDWFQYGFSSEEEFARYLSRNVFLDVFTYRDAQFSRSSQSVHRSNVSHEDKFKQEVLKLLENETGYTIQSLLNLMPSIRLTHVKAYNLLVELSKDITMSLTLTEIQSGEILVGSGRSSDLRKSPVTEQCMLRPDGKSRGLIRTFHVDERLNIMYFYFVDDLQHISCSTPLTTPPLLSHFKPFTVCSMPHSQYSNKWVHYILLQVLIEEDTAVTVLHCLEECPNSDLTVKVSLPSANLRVALPNVMKMPFYQCKVHRHLHGTLPLWSRFQNKDLLAMFLPPCGDETALIFDSDGLELLA